jgi:enoyl-CoA hydratase/carnithine racemase
MAVSGLSLRREGALNIIQFDRIEKKNAITGEMYAGMAASLEAGDADAHVGVHVFFGQPGVFTAGNDIKDFVATAQQEAGLGKEVLGFLRALITVSKPVVAGVDGLAIGIGTTLLMHSDLVYATEQSFFQTPFVDLAVVPEAASSLVAPRMFGYQRAFELLALGQRWSARDALNAGLINRIVAQQDLDQHVKSIAHGIASKPQGALKLTRQLLRGQEQELLQRLDQEAEYFATQLKSSEAQAAFAKFLDRS